MVMGRQAIDLPPLLRTEFTQAGLSHILTASGFHVALVLGFCPDDYTSIFWQGDVYRLPEWINFFMSG